MQFLFCTFFTCAGCDPEGAAPLDGGDWGLIHENWPIKSDRKTG